MAERVVALLEVVKVDEQNRGRHRVLQGTTEMLVEGRAVPQPRQRILCSAVTQRLQSERRVQRAGRVGGHHLEVLDPRPIEIDRLRSRRQQEPVTPTVALQTRGRERLDPCPS